MASVLAALLELGAGLLHELDALSIVADLIEGLLLGFGLLLIPKRISTEPADPVLEVLLVGFAGETDVVALGLALVAEVIVAVLALDLVQVAVDSSIL